MDQYKYTPLDVAIGEIRLIHLLPGRFSDNIEIEIFNTRTHFNEKKREQEKKSTASILWGKLMHSQKSDVPSYEALSYVWGTETDPSFVTIRGKRARLGSSHLSITQNLAEAMRYLRQEHKSRVLWIDAICINQKDLAERSVQVGRMGDIYRNATQVDVWLGPETEDSDIAVNLVHSINADLVPQVQRSGHEFCPALKRPNFLLIQTMSIQEFKPLKNLCRRKWFTRLWIYQEYHLSKAAIGFVGRVTLNLRDLYKVLDFEVLGANQATCLIARGWDGEIYPKWKR
jgi:hypothetical protein